MYGQQVSDRLFNDSLNKKGIIDSSITEEDNYLVNGAYMLLRDFQFRAVTNLSTQHQSYNIDLNRIDNDTRNTTFNFSMQGWFRLSGKVNLGVQANMRTLRVGSFSSSILDILRFRNELNSKTVLRTVAPSVKFLWRRNKFKLVYQSTFFIPLSKSFELMYKEFTFRDANPAQWLHQLYYVRKYSKYFTLNLELNANLRLGQTDGTRGLTLRMPVTPVFNYYFNSNMHFYAFAELNPLLTDGIFSAFLFREGAGFIIHVNSSFIFDIAYSYVALGKKTPAQNNFVFGVRINF